MLTDLWQGIPEPLRDPVALAAPSWRDKLGNVFGPPGWHPRTAPAEA